MKTKVISSDESIEINLNNDMSFSCEVGDKCCDFFMHNYRVPVTLEIEGVLIDFYEMGLDWFNGVLTVKFYKVDVIV